MTADKAVTAEAYSKKVMYTPKPSTACTPPALGNMHELALPQHSQRNTVSALADADSSCTLA